MLQIYAKVFMETSFELVFANIANFRRSLTSNSHKTYFKSHIPALTIHHISTAWPGALNPATHPMPGKSRPAYPMSSKATGAYFPRRPGPPRPPSPPPCKKTRTAMPQYKSSPSEDYSSEGLHKAASYSPASHRSTIGAGGLNFSVRNGKRWDPAAIATKYAFRH